MWVFPFVDCQTRPELCGDSCKKQCDCATAPELCPPYPAEGNCCNCMIESQAQFCPKFPESDNCCNFSNPFLVKFCPPTSPPTPSPVPPGKACVPNCALQLKRKANMFNGCASCGAGSSPDYLECRKAVKQFNLSTNGRIADDQLCGAGPIPTAEPSPPPPLPSCDCASADQKGCKPFPEEGNCCDCSTENGKRACPPFPELGHCPVSCDCADSVKKAGCPAFPADGNWYAQNFPIMTNL